MSSRASGQGRKRSTSATGVRKTSPRTTQRSRSVSGPKGSRSPRARKVYRDTIQGITKAAIKKLIQRGGIKAVRYWMYDEVRGYLTQWVKDVIGDTLVFTRSAGRIRVYVKDVEAALRSRFGNYILAPMNDAAYVRKGADGNDVTESRSSKAFKKYKAISSKKEAEEPAGAAKKAHRFKPGTVSLRDIKKLQKYSDNLILPLQPFQKFVREIAQDEVSPGGSNVSFSTGAIDILQVAAEDYLVKLFSAGAELVALTGNVQLFPKHLETVIAIRRLGH